MPKKKQGSARTTPTLTWLALAVVALALVGGAFTLARGSAPKGSSTHDMTIPADFPPQPDWLANALQPVKTAYLYAANQHDVLQYIPCYCGCGSVHGSNSACYFVRDAQGRVTDYDQHAYG